MYCAYCRQSAVLRIPSVPEHVCREHAMEFWTGLLAYAKERPDCSDRKDEEPRPSDYWSCYQLAAAAADESDAA
jgi:hypothetical protein